MVKNTQVIRNFGDANLLLDKGHKINKIDRDVNNRNFLIFIFKNTDQLQKDLREITIARNKK